MARQEKEREREREREKDSSFASRSQCSKPPMPSPSAGGWILKGGGCDCVHQPAQKSPSPGYNTLESASHHHNVFLSRASLHPALP